MRQQLVTPDLLVARNAARQHGIVTIEQLRRAGLSDDAVKRRVAAGRLHRIRRGVYAVGHAGLSEAGRWMAAVKACGEGAALSHRSAAELWGLLGIRGGPVHVTVPLAGGRARRTGIRVHRSRSLTAAVTTVREGIAVFTPERTLTDLRGAVEPAALRDAVRAAEIAGLPIGDHARLTERTRSELELRFLALIRRHRLPKPEVNVRVERFLVDFLWRKQKLIVETDGERFHRGELAVSEDLRRDENLHALGYEVLRFSYWQVTNEPRKVLALVRARLAERRGQPPDV